MPPLKLGGEATYCGRWVKQCLPLVNLGPETLWPRSVPLIMLVGLWALFPYSYITHKPYVAYLRHLSYGKQWPHLYQPQTMGGRLLVWDVPVWFPQIWLTQGKNCTELGKRCRNRREENLKETFSSLQVKNCQWGIVQMKTIGARLQILNPRPFANCHPKSQRSCCTQAHGQPAATTGMTARRKSGVCCPDVGVREGTNHFFCFHNNPNVKMHLFIGWKLDVRDFSGSKHLLAIIWSENGLNFVKGRKDTLQIYRPWCLFQSNPSVPHGTVG